VWLTERPTAGGRFAAMTIVLEAHRDEDDHRPRRLQGARPVLSHHEGLKGIANASSTCCIFDYIITVPGYPRRVEGRKAIAELYRPY